jgi:hypothetical protein
MRFGEGVGELIEVYVYEYIGSSLGMAGVC